MEALTAASVAALTIYDMCKAVQKDMVIGPVRLLAKRRQIGDFKRWMRMIKVLFFYAEVRELTGTDALDLPANFFPPLSRCDSIWRQERSLGAVALRKTANCWRRSADACPGQFDHPLTAGDEVAFFPPVTGANMHETRIVVGLRRLASGRNILAGGARRNGAVVTFTGKCAIITRAIALSADAERIPA